MPGDNQEEKDVEESEKNAEEAMVASAEYGAPSVSSLAREELRVAEAQSGEADARMTPPEGQGGRSPWPRRLLLFLRPHFPSPTPSQTPLP